MTFILAWIILSLPIAVLTGKLISLYNDDDDDY
jgi:hypothetical protein